MEAARQCVQASAPVLPCQPPGPLQALLQGRCGFPHVQGSLKSSKGPCSMHILRDGAHHVTGFWANVGKERVWSASTARGELVGEDTCHQYLQRHPGHLHHLPSVAGGEPLGRAPVLGLFPLTSYQQLLIADLVFWFPAQPEAANREGGNLVWDSPAGPVGTRVPPPDEGLGVGGLHDPTQASGRHSVGGWLQVATLVLMVGSGMDPLTQRRGQSVWGKDFKVGRPPEPPLWTG